jgi:hypothetical protein
MPQADIARHWIVPPIAVKTGLGSISVRPHVALGRRWRRCCCAGRTVCPRERRSVLLRQTPMVRALGAADIGVQYTGADVATYDRDIPLPVASYAVE